MKIFLLLKERHASYLGVITWRALKAWRMSYFIFILFLFSFWSKLYRFKANKYLHCSVEVAFDVGGIMMSQLVFSVRSLSLFMNFLFHVTASKWSFFYFIAFSSSFDICFLGFQTTFLSCFPQFYTLVSLWISVVLFWCNRDQNWVFHPELWCGVIVIMNVSAVLFGPNIGFFSLGTPCGERRYNNGNLYP